MSVVVRYAPSPTGRLHLGNARPALLNWLFALAHGGAYILRIDDTDTGRTAPGGEAAIVADLAWLGIEPARMVRQSDRIALYDAARDRLIAAGRLYPAYETENELDRKRMRAQAAGKPPIYDRAALSLTDEQVRRYRAEGRVPHWRFRLDGAPVTFTDLVRGEQTVNTASMSDPVLVREDGSYTYTLPSVVDDIDLGITHVIRGEDHISNTGTQIEVLRALGAAPPVFAHANLLTGADGKGLSKRLGSLSLGELRDAGYEPIAVALVAVLTGTSLPVEPYPSLPALAGKLEFSMISHGPARFEQAELDSLNARILHQLDYAAVEPRLRALGLDDPSLWHALRENLARFPQIADWARLVKGPVDPVVAEADREFVTLAAELLPAEPWGEDAWDRWVAALKERTGRKGRALFMPLRLALTGREDGPELRSLMALLGRRECLARLS